MEGFRLVLEDAGVREMPQHDGCDSPGCHFLWEHLELLGPDDAPVQSMRDLPEVVTSALIAEETRPRCDQVGEGAILNLRGPARASDAGDDGLVSIRMWVDGRRAVSVSRRELEATATVRQAMENGRITDAGDLVAAFARAISTELDPAVSQLGDDVDACESAIEEGNIHPLRRKIAVARSRAIAFRRFIAPGRDALVTLAGLKVDWLAEEDRLHIREAADRFARMAEELEAIRERSALLHEQIIDLRSELIDQRNLQITVVAFIFLPLTFISGLLGMNVAGIPFAQEPWAFWGVIAFCVVVGVVVLAWFAFRHWLRR